MKTFQYSCGKLLIIAIACSFTAGATTEAGGFSERNSLSRDRAVLSDNARLIVYRAADFGYLIYLTLYIDGVQVTTLGRNQGYEAMLRPGPHVLSVGTSPSPYGKTRFSYRRVNMGRGQNYPFTALWLDPDNATLEVADARTLARQGIWVSEKKDR